MLLFSVDCACPTSTDNVDNGAPDNSSLPDTREHEPTHSPEVNVTQVTSEIVQQTSLTDMQSGQPPEATSEIATHSQPSPRHFNAVQKGDKPTKLKLMNKVS